MRYVGIDLGARRLGFAVSDPTGTLARPLSTVTSTGPRDAIRQALRVVEALADEEDGLAGIVIGHPRHLDGTPSAETARVEAFAASLRARTALPVALQDERLSSREAESRLAVRERNWRVRKAKLDAAAAAVILQDFLDDGGRDS